MFHPGFELFGFADARILGLFNDGKQHGIIVRKNEQIDGL
jgi:hypothetical protein